MKVKRGKEMIKIRAEQNEEETKETVEMIHESNSWYCEKYTIHKPLARLMKKEKVFKQTKL